MMKDLDIAFTSKEITAFGGLSLLYKMLNNCHFKEALSSVGLPQHSSNRSKSPEQLIYGFSQESGVAQVVTITLTLCASTLRPAI